MTVRPSRRAAVPFAVVKGLVVAGLLVLSGCGKPGAKSESAAVPPGGAASPGTSAETLPGRVPIYAGTWVATLPAADAPGRAVTLKLDADMTATLTMAFTGRGEPNVDRGTWSFHGDEITLELAATDDSGAPMPLIWTVKGDRLVPKAWSHAHYGEVGLPMEKRP